MPPTTRAASSTQAKADAGTTISISSTSERGSPSPDERSEGDSDVDAPKSTPKLILRLPRSTAARTDLGNEAVGKQSIRPLTPSEDELSDDLFVPDPDQKPAVAHAKHERSLSAAIEGMYIGFYHALCY
jgi:hypothetical protein